MKMQERRRCLRESLAEALSFYYTRELSKSIRKGLRRKKERENALKPKRIGNSAERNQEKQDGKL